jgi:hypothetical protein
VLYQEFLPFRVFGLSMGKVESRRADSNRLPLLQLRVCRRTFQTILVHPVIWLICGVFGVSEVIWRPLLTGVYRPGCTMVALCSVELCSSYVPARNPRHVRRPNLALRVTCVERRQGAIYFPGGFALLAANVPSGSLVLPR